MLRRLRAGERLWVAHRAHFYQRAGDNGFSKMQIVAPHVPGQRGAGGAGGVSVVVPAGRDLRRRRCRRIVLVAWIMGNLRARRARERRCPRHRCLRVHRAGGLVRALAEAGRPVRAATRDPGSSFRSVSRKSPLRMIANRSIGRRYSPRSTRSFTWPASRTLAPASTMPFTIASCMWRPPSSPPPAPARTFAGSSSCRRCAHKVAPRPIMC